jgi:hypothetical protein
MSSSDELNTSSTAPCVVFVPIFATGFGIFFTTEVFGIFAAPVILLLLLLRLWFN